MAITDQARETKKGVILSLAGFAAFSCSDGVRKYLTQSYEVADILFWQGALGLLLLLVFAPFSGEMRSALANRNRKYILRGLVMALNTGLSLWALSRIPLVNAYTIYFLSPLVTTLLAGLLLKEAIGFRRLAAIMGGFTGAIIALRPGAASFDYGYLIALSAVFTFSFSNLIARTMQRQQVTTLFAFYPLCFVCVLALVLKGGPPVLPAAGAWWLFGLVGFFYTAALVAVAYAFTYAPAALAALCQYTQVIWALGLGYVIFGHLPDMFTITGGLIVILSGAALLIYERGLKKRVSAS